MYLTHGIDDDDVGGGGGGDDGSWESKNWMPFYSRTMKDEKGLWILKSEQLFLFTELHIIIIIIVITYTLRIFYTINRIYTKYKQQVTIYVHTNWFWCMMNVNVYYTGTHEAITMKPMYGNYMLPFFVVDYSFTIYSFCAHSFRLLLPLRPPYLHFAVFMFAHLLWLQGMVPDSAKGQIYIVQVHISNEPIELS